MDGASSRVGAAVTVYDAGPARSLALSSGHAPAHSCAVLRDGYGPLLGSISATARIEGRPTAGPILLADSQNVTEIQSSAPPPAKALVARTGDGVLREDCALRSTRIAGSTVRADQRGVTDFALGGDFMVAALDDGSVRYRARDRVMGAWTNRAACGVTRVAAGASNACALSDGGVWCWARETERAAEVPELRDVTQIAAAGDVTCALRADGSIACWGRGDVLPGALGGPCGCHVEIADGPRTRMSPAPRCRRTAARRKPTRALERGPGSPQICAAKAGEFPAGTVFVRARMEISSVAFPRPAILYRSQRGDIFLHESAHLAPREALTRLRRVALLNLAMRRGRLSHTGGNAWPARAERYTPVAPSGSDG